MAGKMELGGRGGAGWKKSNLCKYVKIMTKKLWCYDEQPPTHLKKNLHGNLSPDQKILCTRFQIPPIFCISHLPSSLKKNPKIFFGFSDPANFLHQPASSLPKKNPKKIFGFSDPANFLHQPT
jgi:hypothetical protein